MELDGPPRMVGWITWSGRERSSQTQFLPVPGVRLVHPYLSFSSHNVSLIELGLFNRWWAKKKKAHQKIGFFELIKALVTTKASRAMF